LLKITLYHTKKILNRF